MEDKKTNKKPTMAFIDNGIHRLTGSGDFLREILTPYFDITDYWDETWKNGNDVSPDKINKFDYVFFEQCINNETADILKIRARMIWAPMIDGYNNNYFFWKILKRTPLCCLSLSNAIERVSQHHNIRTFGAKYYVNPEQYKNVRLPATGKHFFFWYRGGLRFSELKKIIRPEDVDSFIYKSNPDISYEKEELSEKDIKDYKITLINEGYTPREDYLKLLARANIYIAPRKMEGIGVSFLEAIAMGHCVIAYNAPTMNEYIVHGENGYLFNEKTKETIDFSNLEKIKEESKKRAEEGYNEWYDSIPQIISFIKATQKPADRIPATALTNKLYMIERRLPYWKRTFFRYYGRLLKKINKKNK